MSLFFGKRGESGPLVRGRSGREQVLRFFGLIAVFMVVIWLFWIYSDSYITEIESRSAIFDQAGLLTQEQEQSLSAFVQMFREEFGMQLKIHIMDEPLSMPALDSKTLFIALNPGQQKALVEFPPLVRRALGDEFPYELQNEHFPAYYEEGRWQEGLLKALELIWHNLHRGED